MATVYKLISPIDNSIYYVGYTEKPLSVRLVQHLSKPIHPTTIALISVDKIPIIDIIVSGDNISKIDETFYIKKLFSEGHKLENIDQIINYQERKSLFDLPDTVKNGIIANEEDKYKCAIDLISSEMPLNSSIPIIIRIQNILDWVKK